MPVLFYFVIVRMCRLTPWIFCRISYTCRLIITDFLNRYTNIFEYFEESFSMMSECYCAMMREASLDQHVTVETSHLRNCKYSDCSKGTCCNRKNLSMCDISTKLVIRSALQTIECDICLLYTSDAADEL